MVQPRGVDESTDSEAEDESDQLTDGQKLQEVFYYVHNSSTTWKQFSMCRPIRPSKTHLVLEARQHQK